jgi:precorrin-6B methylase 2
MTDAGAMFSDGKVYERMMGRWSKLVGRVFLEWLNAPKNLKWIEVGCGNGAFTEELIAHCAPLEVTAVEEIETRQIRIPVTYSSFEDFCESNLVPIGPAGQVLKAMSPAEIVELKDRLREILPIAADGRIAYEAFANAIKGKAPG